MVYDTEGCARQRRTRFHARGAARGLHTLNHMDDGTQLTRHGSSILNRMCSPTAVQWALGVAVACLLGCGRIGFESLTGQSARGCSTGACGDLAPGERCEESTGCNTGVCSGEVCQPASCDDGIQNAAESGIDCGGSCQRCLGALDAPGSLHSQRFGSALAQDNLRLLVGAPSFSGLSRPGDAYLYERNKQLAWEQTAALSGETTDATDLFGTSVALLGDLAAVGAPQEDAAGYASAGAVYIFERQSDGTWAKAARLESGLPEPFGSFGHSVALRGTTLFVGAPIEQGASGAVYVFERDTASAPVWQQAQRLVPAVRKNNASMGRSLAVDGSWLIAGAPGYPGLSPFQGGAYAFAVEDGTWTERPGTNGAPLLRPDVIAEEQQRAGDAVAIEATSVALGAPKAQDDAGAVFIFSLPTGSQVAHLLPPGASQTDHFGSSIGLSNERVLIGAPGRAMQGALQAGAVERYAGLTDATWQHLETLFSQVPGTQHQLGSAISSADGLTFFGAPGTPTLHPDVGAVEYVGF